MTLIFQLSYMSSPLAEKKEPARGSALRTPTAV